MIPQPENSSQISHLPKPKRNRPAQLNRVQTNDEPVYGIDRIQLTGRQWARLLSLLCSVVKEDEYLDLDVAKIAAQCIDDHLQDTPKFKEEVEMLRQTGGPEIEELIAKLTTHLGRDNRRLKTTILDHNTITFMIESFA